MCGAAGWFGFGSCRPRLPSCCSRARSYSNASFTAMRQPAGPCTACWERWSTQSWQLPLHHNVSSAGRTRCTHSDIACARICLQAACPNCGEVNTTYFGDILTVAGKRMAVGTPPLSLARLALPPSVCTGVGPSGVHLRAAWQGVPASSGHPSCLLVSTSAPCCCVPPLPCQATATRTWSSAPAASLSSPLMPTSAW